MRVGYLPTEIYRKFSVFPFGGRIQTQTDDDDNQEQQQTQGFVSLRDFVRVGYIQANTYLLTGAALYALEKRYFTIEHFRSMKIWPCPVNPSLNSFVTAGYASYSGHLTTLGYSLLHVKYFPHEWLAKIGIHLHIEFHIIHQALRYGGFFNSDYETAHNTASNVNSAVRF